MKEPQAMKEPQQVTTKNPNKVKVGKRLAEYNHRKREEKKVKREEQAQKSELNQYYGIGAILAVGVIGGLGYYIYRTKKGEVPNSSTSWNPPNQPSSPVRQTNKFEMD